MCVLCERESLLRLGINTPIGLGGAMESGNDVSENVLIDDASSSYSRSLVATDQLMTIYLHAAGGAVQVTGGGFGTQIIQSNSIPSGDQDYLYALTDDLEKYIDLTFSFVGSPSDADISIYYDSEIKFNDAENVLGLATGGYRGWELFIDYSELGDLSEYRKYVLAHEFGHSLGLEHPFDNSDGDVFEGITDPWASAYPEDTVMAYRSPLGGSWPDYFSTADLRALVQIWGAPSSVYGNGADRVVGLSSDESFYLAGGDDWIEAGFGNDEVMGGSGADELYGNQGLDTLLGGLGNDLIYGGKDNDRLYGNEGADYLYGNVGDDMIYGGKDNDRLYGNEGADYLYGNLGSDWIFAGQNDDWINGGPGNDFLYGNKGADIFSLSSGSDLIYDFSFSEGDMLEVSGSQALGYEQKNLDLLVIHALGIVTLVSTQIGINYFEEFAVLRT